MCVSYSYTFYLLLFLLLNFKNTQTYYYKETINLKAELEVKKKNSHSKLPSDKSPEPVSMLFHSTAQMDFQMRLSLGIRDRNSLDYWVNPVKLHESLREKDFSDFTEM